MSKQTPMPLLKIGQHSLVLIFALLSFACGKNGESLTGGDSPGITTADNQVIDGNIQIGARWDRAIINSDSELVRNDHQVRRAAWATAKVITPFALGTGFYIGKVDGEYLVATNYHVMINIPSCKIGPFIPYIDFTLSGIKYRCKDIVAEFKDLDLVIMSVAEREDGHGVLEHILPLQFAFQSVVKKGTPLLAVGHGRQGNEDLDLTVARDSDCKVFSDDSRFKKVSSPDSQRIRMSVWSFATGCDLSAGDSGSAAINANTGEILGIFWASPTPKPFSMRSPTILADIYAKQDERLWESMSYAAPATMIYQKMREYIANSNNLKRRREIISKLIGHPL
jgi:hypothetical protein